MRAVLKDLPNNKQMLFHPFSLQGVYQDPPFFLELIQNATSWALRDSVMAWLAYDMVVWGTVSKGAWAIGRLHTAAGWPNVAGFCSSITSTVLRDCAISSVPAICADQILRDIAIAAAAYQLCKP